MFEQYKVLKYTVFILLVQLFDSSFVDPAVVKVIFPECTGLGKPCSGNSLLVLLQDSEKYLETGKNRNFSKVVRKVYLTIPKPYGVGMGI